MKIINFFPLNYACVSFAAGLRFLAFFLSRSSPVILFSLVLFFLFLCRERRQVGIRAVNAVNSAASLSALMSLLLFALLNAIRAYSMSLTPVLLSASPSLLHTHGTHTLQTENNTVPSSQSSHEPLDRQLKSLRESIAQTEMYIPSVVQMRV